MAKLVERHGGKVDPGRWKVSAPGLCFIKVAVAGDVATVWRRIETVCQYVAGGSSVSIEGGTIAVIACKKSHANVTGCCFGEIQPGDCCPSVEGPSYRCADFSLCQVGREVGMRVGYV